MKLSDKLEIICTLSFLRGYVGDKDLTTRLRITHALALVEREEASDMFPCMYRGYEKQRGNGSQYCSEHGGCPCRQVHCRKAMDGCTCQMPFGHSGPCYIHPIS